MSGLADLIQSLADAVKTHDMPSLTVLLTGSVALLVIVTFIRSASKPKSAHPVINEPSSWYSIAHKKDYFFNARKLLVEGTKKFDGPFNINTENGSVLMLPPEQLDLVNAEPKLSFEKYATTHFNSELESFRTFRAPPSHMLTDAVMKGLTRALPKFTRELSTKMKECLESSWGDNTEWREVDPKAELQEWVARLSSRIFLGPRFSEDDDWCRIAVSFTVDVFTASMICGFFPWPLKYLVERFLPLCRKVRRDRRECAKKLIPVLKERNAIVAKAEREGKKPDVPNDAIEWFRASSKGRIYDEVDIQITLQVAAIHTTSDLLTQTVLNLCAHPELFAPLREEAVIVLRKYGWQKLALTELRLLDSVFKETQRLKPVTMASMHREALADVKLANGILIRKGEHLGIFSRNMWNGDIYENPEKFDGFRFLKRREIPGQENRSLLVSTSPDHLGFAHGVHACPGRFFAANEVKIMLVHMIMKYDMKMEDPRQAKWQEFGIGMVTNSKARIMIRKRTPEIDIDNLEFD